MSDESNTNGQAPAAESQVSETSTENTEETGEELADSEETSEAPILTKSEEKKFLKSLKLKIDGKEYDEELPFEIPDDEASKAYMTKQLQMSKVSQKRMAESAKMQQDMQEFIQLLKDHPEEILSDPNIGIDLKKFATKIIEKEIENSRKSPEQLEKEKLESELKKMKEERENEKKTAREKEKQRLEQQEFERYDVLMTQALEKSDLPKSPYVVKKMADMMILAVENGHDVGPADVLPLVREEIMQDIKEMFAVMPEDVIEQMVGSEKISKLRKKRIAAAKTAAVGSPSQIKDTGKTAPKTDEAPKKISLADFLKS